MSEEQTVAETVSAEVVNTPVNANDDIEAMQMNLIGDYESLLPGFNASVDGLSNNQLRRLIKALVSVPLTLREYKPPTATEKDIFNTGRRLIEINVILTLSTLTEAINKLDMETPASTNEGEVSHGETSTNSEQG